MVSALFARRGRVGADWTDWVSRLYLLLGVLVMFGPVLWLVTSSFKSEAGLNAFPPTLLPWQPATAAVPGFAGRLPLVRTGNGHGPIMAEVRHLGLMAQLVDPHHGGAIVRAPLASLRPVRKLRPRLSNYTELIRRFNFLGYFWNSVFITVVATAITLLVNSMAAFALSKYRFRGRDPIFLLMLATLMVPPTIVLVPNFLIAARLDLVNSLWGVIWPGAATPTGVFLLRQYMLTIPDDLIEAARMDNASEWRIYWRIILPLTRPALAVLAIFSMMWRWNDFLWPLVVLNRSSSFTLQLALFSFKGDLQTQWNHLIAMTVLTLLPITIIFLILQRSITQGIAQAGVK